MANFKIDLLHPIQKKSLNECTWAEIKEICDLGLASDIWKVGDTKTIYSERGNYTATLVDLQAGRYCYTKTGQPTHAVFQLNIDATWIPSFSEEIWDSDKDYDGPLSYYYTLDKDDYIQYWDDQPTSHYGYYVNPPQVFKRRGSDPQYSQYPNHTLYTSIFTDLNPDGGFQCWSWDSNFLINLPQNTFYNLYWSGPEDWNGVPYTYIEFTNYISPNHEWEDNIFVTIYLAQGVSNPTIVFTKKQRYTGQHTLKENILFFITRNENYDIYNDDGSILYPKIISVNTDNIYYFYNNSTQYNAAGYYNIGIKKSFWTIKSFGYHSPQTWEKNFHMSIGINRNGWGDSIKDFWTTPFLVKGNNLNYVQLYFDNDQQSPSHTGIFTPENNSFLCLQNYLFKITNGHAIFIDFYPNKLKPGHRESSTVQSRPVRRIEHKVGTYYKSKNYYLALINKNEWHDDIFNVINIIEDSQENLYNYIDYVDIPVINIGDTASAYSNTYFYASEKLFLPNTRELNLRDSENFYEKETISLYNSLSYGSFTYYNNTNPLNFQTCTRTSNYWLFNNFIYTTKGNHDMGIGSINNGINVNAFFAL